MTGRIKTILAALALAGAFTAGWTAQGWRADAAAARVQAEQSGKDVTQAQQSQAATESKAGALLQHARDQQDNTHDYTQKMAQLEAGRAADAARIAGLQRDISSAATRSAQAASDAAACRSLADRHQRLAALAGEGGAVVAGLAGLVHQRDTEIGLLAGQIRADRVLLLRD
ncbi:hypothetical protein [Comamonas terrigena]|uniref:DUF2514 domain-containing protein n=1 Tax=Comamonas terrigena TaxID=32013 RepID=A0A2A7UXS4_COMTR|nr:hypothetical protein [Comamonas terrigena]PEH90053.1 hypothetical protein CRM82_16950 [Comamonas terrigena]BBL25341.1 hypothetical protein CT3_27960 [Comamonas terrigena NBRC 13299]